MNISRKQAQRIVSSCCDAKVEGFKLFGGRINTLYELTLSDKRHLMLRLFNESWKARKEAFLYDQLSSLNVPIPQVLGSSDGKVPYLLYEKIPGIHIDEVYKKTKNLALFEQAGEILAKLHTMTFDKFGWIVGGAVRPAFKKWGDFALYDIGYKLGKLRAVTQMRVLRQGILNYFDDHMGLLEVSSRPCLVHKDFYAAHILANPNNVVGVIDFEWAISGHNENDFTKLERWVFPKIPESRNAFFKGYKRFGTVSSKYDERKDLYKLWHFVNMANISNEIGDKKTLSHTLKELAACLKTCRK
ncbi:MAG: aminoglycoside phosphotransferase family protein [Nanoarchaeota archaeon]|nr:aminoglycoside phosphotransferase family protein [Nanoarchaeota archaeon]